MSGLSPVPRIPNRCSTMNGSEAIAPATSASGRSETSALDGSSSRRTTTTPAAAQASPSAITAAVPSPGSRTVAQATAISAASPTAGASRDQPRRPQRANTACPTTAEAPSTSRNDA